MVGVNRACATLKESWSHLHGPVPVHSRLLHNLVFITLACLMGCGHETATPVCEAPGVGRGPCCTLERPDGYRERGICQGAYCVNDRVRLADPRCAAESSTLDAEVDATDFCAASRCGDGRECDPANGACVPAAQQPLGGPCQETTACAEGRCYVDRTGRVPGGFCAVDCQHDADCEQGRCLAVEGGRLCFPSCDESCRPGWDCRAAPDGRGRVCQIDCRVAGCPAGQRCDFQTASCGPRPAQCRYPCGAEEDCRDGRCVRRGGDCETDYHCAAGMACLAGECAPEEFTPCDLETPCSDLQRCVPVTSERGVCLQRCETAAECASGRLCRPDLGACYWALCGGMTGNGVLLGACAGGPLGAQLGTCLPFDFELEPGAEVGRCVVAGVSAPGEPCDAQATERTEDAAGIMCEPGSICFGDPDDPDAPGNVSAGRGRCARLCADDGTCSGDERCIRPLGLSRSGERLAVGLCLPINCVFGRRDCPSGERCLIYSWNSSLGRCTRVGMAGRGAVCEAATDCLGRGVCPMPYPSRCVDVCDPAGLACEDGRCDRLPGWALGMCR